MAPHSSIWLIEDSPGERELFRLALAQSGFDVALYTQHDADAALHLLRTQPTLPSLILLDWHIQNQRGDGFLKRLRSEIRFASIPVVVFTTSDHHQDLTASYRCGANGYVVKPGTFDELVRCVDDICQYWLDRNRTPYMVETRC